MFRYGVAAPVCKPCRLRRCEACEGRAGACECACLWLEIPPPRTHPDRPGRSNPQAPGRDTPTTEGET